MTHTYTQSNAYDIIQKDIEDLFHRYIKKERGDIKCIVIVGAHHGNEIPRLLRNYPNAIVHAYEAYPTHFNTLQSTFKDKPRVRLYCTAVSDVVGTIQFHELSVGGSGSILKFQGDAYGHYFKTAETVEVPSTTLRESLKDTDIDLLWVDVQGAELKVLHGTDLSRCASLFLEIHTRDYIKEWDKEPYIGQCYKEDLEGFLVGFKLHSIGLDNANGNGQGNSFWITR